MMQAVDRHTVALRAKYAAIAQREEEAAGDGDEDTIAYSSLGLINTASSSSPASLTIPTLDNITTSTRHSMPDAATFPLEVDTELSTISLPIDASFDLVTLATADIAALPAFEAASLPSEEVGQAEPAEMGGVVDAGALAASVGALPEDPTTYDVEANMFLLSQVEAACLALCTHKVERAALQYDEVDGIIRRLDLHLKRFETKIRRSTRDVTAAPVDFRRKRAKLSRADVEDARDIRFQMQAELKKELGKQSSKSEGFVDSVEPKYCKCGVRA
jgi:hypothetical protein